MKKFKIVSLAFLVAIILIGCVSNSNKATQEKIGKKTIFTSFYPVEFLTSKIVGDKMTVKNIMPNGSFVHDWEPSAKEMADLSKADLLVINGVGLEGWIDKLKENTGKLKIVDTSKGINLLEIKKDSNDAHKDHDHSDGDHKDGDKHDHDHGDHDPHIWLSPKNALVQSKTILDEVIKLDPNSKEYFEQNYLKLTESLKMLDKKYTDELSKEHNKYIIVPHEAFGYLARDYKINQVPVLGINSDKEPSAKGLKELVNFAKSNKISTVFFAKGEGSKVTETLASEIGAKLKPLYTMEGLTKEDISSGMDYIKFMESNLNSIVEALK